MKSITGWDEPNIGATNSSGFNGFPAGTYIPWLDKVRFVGILGCWWTSVPANNDEALDFILNHQAAYVYTGNLQKRIGSSVRCIKD